MKISTIAMLLATGLVLLVGCGDEKEEFSRYPSLRICAYTESDYIPDLSDGNPEVVYNAVCNLGNSAREFGKTLSAEETDPESEAYKTAQAAYQSVCGLLESRDPLVVAASLRFLQLFVRDYTAKAELIEPVCRVESPHPLVQFEQVELLGRLVNETTHLPEPLLRRLLDSKSWIVSRTTYQLIGTMKDEPLRQELVKRFRVAGDEKEKILILSALAANTRPDEIVLAKEEILATDHPTIRSTAIGLLFENSDAPGVLAWVIEHYPEWNPEDENREEMFDIVCDVDEETKVEATRLLLAKGYVPDDEFLHKLNKRFEDHSKELPEHLLGIEEAISAVPEVATRWQAIRQQTEDWKSRCTALQEELKPLMEEYVEKVQPVLTEHGVPDEVQQNFLKQATNLNVKSMISESSP